MGEKSERICFRTGKVRLRPYHASRHVVEEHTVGPPVSSFAVGLTSQYLHRTMQNAALSLLFHTYSIASLAVLKYHIRLSLGHAPRSWGHAVSVSLDYFGSNMPRQCLSLQKLCTALVIQVGDTEKFPHALGFGSLDPLF